MSKGVASKGTWVQKSYHRKPMFTDFPADTPLKYAIAAILLKYGERPEKPLHTDHSFAEIISHSIFVRKKVEPLPPVEKLEQPKIL